jgi:hypothetical protein
MSIEAAIYDRLYNQSGIRGLTGTRIYPAGQAPANATLDAPLLTHEIQSMQRPGILNGRCPVANYQVRVTGFANSHATMKVLMDGVANALDVWKDGRVIMSSIQERATNPQEEQPESFSESHVYSVWYQTEV